MRILSLEYLYRMIHIHLENEFMVASKNICFLNISYLISNYKFYFLL